MTPAGASDVRTVVELVDYLCRCGWGRLSIPAGSVQQCPMCGFSFELRPAIRFTPDELRRAGITTDAIKAQMRRLVRLGGVDPDQPDLKADAISDLMDRWEQDRWQP